MTSFILPGLGPKLSINVTTHHGKVVLQFSSPVTDLALEPQEAAQLAHAIAQQTSEVAKQRGLAFSKGDLQ